MDLAQKHVVVTGGAGGLGGAVVARFRDAGAIVHVPVEGEIDLTDEAQVVAYYAKLPAAPWASVHLVGGFLWKPLAETTRADLTRQLELNVTTVFLCAREAAKRMGDAGGRIVNVSARTGLSPAKGMVAYAAAKAAVAALTKGLADELADQKILVNAIAPSIIDTPANRKSMPDADFTRWPKPAELAEAIYYLASPSNTVTSGEILTVYGRW